MKNYLDDPNVPLPIATLLNDLQIAQFTKTVPVNATMAMAEAGAAVVPGLTVTQAASIYRAMIEVAF